MSGIFTYPPASLSLHAADRSSLSHGYTYGEALVNTLISNFIMRGNLLTPGNYLPTGRTLKHPVLEEALLGFNLLSV